MQKLPLTLNESQAGKLVRRQPVQLKHSQLLPEHRHYLMLHPETHKRAMKAMAAGKGLRITLTPEEIEASGSGFFDLLKKAANVASKVGRFVKEKIIDSNLYQKQIKPEVRKLVDSGESALQTVLPAPVAGVSKTLIDALGNKTGAYGLIEIPATKKAAAKPKPKAAKPKAAKSKTAVGGSFIIG
jgi:hypothetical protein